MLLQAEQNNVRHNTSVMMHNGQQDPWRNTKEMLASKYSSKDQTSAIYRKLSLFQTSKSDMSHLLNSERTARISTSNENVMNIMTSAKFGHNTTGVNSSTEH